MRIKPVHYNDNHTIVLGLVLFCISYCSRINLYYLTF